MGQIQLRPTKVPNPKPVSTTRSATSQTCGGTTQSPRSRQTHNFRSMSLPAMPSATITFVSAPAATTVTSNAKSLDQPSLSAPSVLTPTVPTRTQTNAITRPARPETVLNFAPVSNLPAFSHLAGLYDNPKPARDFFLVDTFDDALVQPRVEAAPPLLSQSTSAKSSLLDAPTTCVGQNLSVSSKPTFSYDDSVSTLRNLLESPSSHGLQSRRLGNTLIDNVVSI